MFTDSDALLGLLQFSTDRIIIVKVRIDDYRAHSLNDVLFFVYRDFLQSLKKKPAMVFMTDGSDVEMVQNPFCSFIKDNTLYLGSDDPSPDSAWWMQHQFEIMQRTHRDNVFGTGSIQFVQFAKYQTVNAGVIGGEVAVVLELLEKMTALFNKFDGHDDINMGVLNVIAWTHYKD